MSRVKLTEQHTKTLLNDDYVGVTFNTDSNTDIDQFLEKLAYQAYVVKVDQGVKKRAKQGLLKIDVNKETLKKFVTEMSALGYTNFLIEPVVRHDRSQEGYLSFSNHRNGVQVLYSETGGVDIESNPEKVKKSLITPDQTWSSALTHLNLPPSFLKKVESVYNDGYFCFLEINPFIVDGGEVLCLDAAATVDSSASTLTKLWNSQNIVTKNLSASEMKISELAKRSSASLNYSLLNPNGSIFTLLSGGGASLVVTDVFTNDHDLLGNYGEYSGSPSEEETYLYAKNIIEDLLLSNSLRKALLISGGVANFTDVEITFRGIKTALSERANELKKQNVLVFVRRGGPNEKIGLENLKNFLEQSSLLGSVYGSETSLVKASQEAIRYVRQYA